MIGKKEEQIGLFDQDTWFSRMCLASSPQTKEETSEESSKKPRGSSVKLPLFLNLQSGQTLDVSWEMGGVLLGEYTMQSFGALPREERDCRLSQILEDSVPQKYYLSAKACAGILRRAEERGRELPKVLKETLERQAFKNVPESRGGGKGILIQEEKTGTLSTINNQCVMLGFDGYNQTVTGERSKQLTSSATDSDHVPIVFNSEPLLSEKEKPQSEILCLNGQGGSSMYISNNVTGTLRAEMKGHEPILLEMQSTRHEVHDDGIAVTLRARMGTGGNNVDAILW